jgi:DNA-binding NtrC family response regulator
MQDAPSRSAISNSSRRRVVRRLVGTTVADVERELIVQTLADADGNRTVSARILGVSIRTLRNKITEYTDDGIDVQRPRSDSSGNLRSDR